MVGLGIAGNTTAAGTDIFFFDATTPDNSPDNGSTNSLAGTWASFTPVPLPAASWMLLAGLIGLKRKSRGAQGLSLRQRAGSLELEPRRCSLSGRVLRMVCVS